jgi:hypothetical protein
LCHLSLIKISWDGVLGWLRDVSSCIVGIEYLSCLFSHFKIVIICRLVCFLYMSYHVVINHQKGGDWKDLELEGHDPLKGMYGLGDLMSNKVALTLWLQVHNDHNSLSKDRTWRKKLWSLGCRRSSCVFRTRESIGTSYYKEGHLDQASCA